MSQEKQKIVYILPEFRDDIGTHFYHKYELLKEVSKDSDIFLIIEKGTAPRDFKNVRVLRFQFWPFRALEYIFVFQRLRRDGYKTFWTHYAFLGAITAPLFGKSFYWNCGMPWLYKRGIFEEWIFRLALKRSLLVTGTEGLKKAYAREYGLNLDRIFVLPNWISLERFSEWRGGRLKARTYLGIEPDQKVILFLHRISKRKGADLIVPVANAFLRDPKALFLVAGSGPLDSEIKGENIRYVGEISQKEVPKYLAASDIFFMPSEEEGFPHVLLEAMALGIPVVASDVGGVKEIVPELFFDFIVERHPEYFVAAIQTILENRDLYIKLSEAGVTWVSQYALQMVAHQFKRLVTTP